MQVNLFTLQNVKALVLTVVLELLVLALFREKNLIIYLALIIVNCVTNLTMNFLLSLYFEYYAILLTICEIAVVFIESAVYLIFYKNFLRSIRFAFCANLVSWLASYIIIFL